MDVIGFLCVSLGSSTVQLYDSVSSRRECPEVGFSSQNGGDHAWGVYYSLEIVTEATVQQVEDVIRADRRITKDIVTPALGRSHSFSYSIMHDCLKFQYVCPENRRLEKKWTQRVCPCNISCSMQMKKVCLTGLLLIPGTNRGCITTNPN
jgi:hypothetical protein